MSNNYIYLVTNCIIAKNFINASLALVFLRLKENKMTTVAWDGRTLATDSQAMGHGLVCSTREQKIYTPGENVSWAVNGNIVHAIGTSGDCGTEFELQEKLAQGINYTTEFSPAVTFAIIAICGYQHAYIVSKDAESTRISISLQVDPYAVGSGATVAITAMKLGKSAIESVELAIELDPYSGGDIQSYACT